jgi:hypothetical protein
MFVRSVLSTYSRLLTGVSLALMAASTSGDVRFPAAVRAERTSGGHLLNEYTA